MALLTTPQAVIAIRWPNFPVVDPRLTALIDLASNEMGAAYGKNRPLAIALLVMHWEALTSRSSDDSSIGNETGSIRSEKEGDLSRSYGSTSSTSSSSSYDDMYLSQTSWGLEIIRLRRKSFMMPRNRMHP